MGISNLRTRVLVTLRDQLGHSPDCVDGLWDAKSGDDMLFFFCMSLPSMKKYLSREAYWVRYHCLVQTSAISELSYRNGIGGKG